MKLKIYFVSPGISGVLDSVPGRDVGLFYLSVATTKSRHALFIQHTGTSLIGDQLLERLFLPTVIGTIPIG